MHTFLSRFNSDLCVWEFAGLLDKYEDEWPLDVFSTIELGGHPCPESFITSLQDHEADSSQESSPETGSPLRIPAAHLPLQFPVNRAYVGASTQEELNDISN